jgi:outer membrane protein assembly factor BamB
MIRSIPALCAISLTIGISTARAENWPRFRGPNGEGVSASKNIPVTWTEGDSAIWKTVLPGVGHSSPVIWGDRLFVQSATATERMLVCIRVTDGKELWAHRAPGAKAHIHDKNSWASSTPATDGKRVYAAFWDGDGLSLRAFEVDGKPLWQRDLGGFKSQHGAGLSPIVFEDRVIVVNDQDVSAAILAFNASDGKPLWTTPRGHYRACYSTPFLLERPTIAPELVVGSTMGLAGYDPRTGKELWKWDWKFVGMPLRTVASPIYGQGIILLNSGDGSGPRNTVAVRLEGAGKATKASLAWQNKRDFPYVPCLLVHGDYVYSVTDDGIAGCHELKTGREIRRERLNCSVTASPILIDGKVYAVSDQGDVYVFEAAPEFKLLGRSPIGEAVTASPAAADDRLFVRGEKHLICIGKAAKSGRGN